MTEAKLTAVAHSIFVKPDAFVVEAYSAPGEEPIRFPSPEAVLEYGEHQTRTTGDSAKVHLAVHYPDMLGRIIRERIALQQIADDGRTFRYTHRGWGLVWVYVELGKPSPVGSFVSAYTEAGAIKWAAEAPQNEPPSAWDWKAVARHCTRLKRALRSS